MTFVRLRVGERVRSILCTSDKHSLVSTDRHVVVLRGTEVRHRVAVPSPPLYAAFGADDSTFALGWRSELRFFDAEAGGRRAFLASGLTALTGAFGSYASGHQDGRVLTWTSTGAPAAEGRCAHSKPAHVIVCPGPQRFISASDDRRLRFWDSSSDEVIETNPFTGWISVLAIGPSEADAALLVVDKSSASVVSASTLTRLARVGLTRNSMLRGAALLSTNTVVLAYSNSVDFVFDGESTRKVSVAGVTHAIRIGAQTILAGTAAGTACFVDAEGKVRTAGNAEAPVEQVAADSIHMYVRTSAQELWTGPWAQ